MANSHWSQFSYRSKVFFLDAEPVVLSVILALLGQFTGFALFLLAVLWVYYFIFAVIYKMPLQYTPAYIRTKITGKNKVPRNDIDIFQV